MECQHSEPPLLPLQSTERERQRVDATMQQLSSPNLEHLDTIQSNIFTYTLECLEKYFMNTASHEPTLNYPKGWLVWIFTFNKTETSGMTAQVSREVIEYVNEEIGTLDVDNVKKFFQTMWVTSAQHQNTCYTILKQLMGEDFFSPVLAKHYLLKLD